MLYVHEKIRGRLLNHLEEEERDLYSKSSPVLHPHTAHAVLLSSPGQEYYVLTPRLSQEAVPWSAVPTADPLGQRIQVGGGTWGSSQGQKASASCPWLGGTGAVGPDID